MAKMFFITLLSFVISLGVSAQQKYGYLYSEKIFKSLAEYNSAIDQLEAYGKSASERGEKMIEQVKSAYIEYAKIRSSLSESQRSAKDREFIAQEKSANSFEEEFFGEDGPMARKQKELLEPIERRVLNAVNAVAEELGYDMIFDLSNSRSTIYQSEKLDLTETVIDRLK